MRLLMCLIVAGVCACGCATRNAANGNYPLGPMLDPVTEETPHVIIK